MAEEMRGLQPLAFLREEKDTGRLLNPVSILKATCINHLSYGVKNYEETRDWYMDIFGMECVYDDGKQASVVCGTPHREIYVRNRDKAPFIDHWAISIADYNAEEVHATLLKWGIQGVSWDGDAAWHADDDNGFRTQICAETGLFPGAAQRGWNTEGKVPSGAKAKRPSKTGWEATAMNHIAYGVPDYKRTRDFYIDLFGMRVVFDDGLKCAVNFGPGSGPEDAIYITQRADGPVIDHIAISIKNFSLKGTEDTIKKLGMEYHPDGDSAWTLLDPNGYRVQVCAEKGVYPGAGSDFAHQIKK